MTRLRSTSAPRPRSGRGVVRAVVAAALAAAVAVAGPAAMEPAQAAATCDTAEGFSRLSGGTLFRLSDSRVLAGVNTLSESGQIGRGWGGFAWTGAGGDGVVYALTTAGKLVWYRYDASANGWAAGSGRVVGIGFTPGTRVVNIAVGANGWIYTVRSDRKLVAYQHTGRMDGAATWTNSGGFVLGTGWTANDLIAPQGDGIIYRQTGGNLFWYRHSDPTAGPVTWNNGGRGVKIGSGWRYYDLLPLGGGVLLATTAPSGQVTLWQHSDPVSGGQGWSVANRKKYLARSDSFGVLVSPSTCS